MLTPADIAAQQFTATRIKEGYDVKEVDTFLDRVQLDYEAALAGLEDAQRQVRNLEKQLELRTEVATTVLPPPPATGERILQLAQETADKHIAEAIAEADDIVRQAGGKGARIVEEAQEAAERIKNEGYAEKAKRLADLEAQHQQVTSAVQQLQAKGTKIQNALRDALSNIEGRL